MLDAVYVDSKENMIVATKPKAPIKPVFEAATTQHRDRRTDLQARLHEYMT